MSKARDEEIVKETVAKPKKVNPSLGPSTKKGTKKQQTPLTEKAYEDGSKYVGIAFDTEF